MKINLNFIAADNPTAAFETGIEDAAAILEATFVDNVTINLNIGFGEVEGQPLTNGSAAAGPDSGQFVSYATVRSDLLAQAAPGDSNFNSLPSGSTVQGQSSIAVWNAQLKLFGILGANDTTTDDGSAGFATDIPANLLVGVALHELTHAMGRVPFGPQPDIFDLFRFTSVGTRLLEGGSTAPPAYFSVDGGNTKIADYGQNSDSSDFLNPPASNLTPNDPFNEFYDPSTFQQLTAIDLVQMDVLGFHAASTVNWVDANGDWSTAADWSSGTVPGSADSVVVAQGAPQIRGETETAGSVGNFAEIDLVSVSHSSPASLQIGGSLVNGGKIVVSAQTLASVSEISAATLNNTGSIVLSALAGSEASATITGATTGSGTISLASGSLVEFGGGVAAGQTVAFDGGTGETAVLDAPGSFAGAVTGFGGGTTLHLSGETVNALSYIGSTMKVGLVAGGTQTLTVTGVFSGLTATNVGGNSIIVGIGHTYSLVGGDVAVFVPGSGPNTVRATAATLSPGDSLTGSGNDTLALTGGGTINLGSLAHFSGFSEVTLDNHSYSISVNDTDVAAGQTLTANVTSSTATGAISFNGGAETNGNFFIRGGAGNDSLIGGAGNDTLYGGAGADVMKGNGGNDFYYVDNPGDKVIEAVGGGRDTVAVTTSITYALSPGQEVEVLRTGGSASTTQTNLTGNEFANTILGNAAANVITGGGGDDVLYGAGGADTFVFAANFGRDSIMDFTAGNGVGHDVIAINHTLFANFAAVQSHTADTGASAVITFDANDTIRLFNVHAATLVASDFSFT